MSWKTFSLCRRAFSSVVATPANAGLWRSFFYVPGDQPQKIKKIAHLHQKMSTNDFSQLPDLVVLDCEDAVSFDRKDAARSSVSKAFTGDGGDFCYLREHLKRRVIVRINDVYSGHSTSDLELILSTARESYHKHSSRWPGPDLVCLPKVESADELMWLTDLTKKLLEKIFNDLGSSFGLVAMIESTSAVLNLKEICMTCQERSIPLAAVVFGSDDYCASLGVERSDSNWELQYPRQVIPVIAKAYGLVAVDMVEIDVKALDKLKRNCELGCQLGFSGKQVIHPGQVLTVNQAFSPTTERVEWATSLIAAAEKEACGDALAAGAFLFRGRMIDRPTIRQAEQLARIAKLLHSS